MEDRGETNYVGLEVCVHLLVGRGSGYVCMQTSHQ